MKIILLTLISLSTNASTLLEDFCRTETISQNAQELCLKNSELPEKELKLCTHKTRTVAGMESCLNGANEENVSFEELSYCVNSTLTVPGQDDCIAAAKNPNLGYKDLVRCNEDHYSRESVESCLDQVN
jgi:hypothetical protein